MDVRREADERALQIVRKEIAAGDAAYVARITIAALLLRLSSSGWSWQNHMRERKLDRMTRDLERLEARLDNERVT